MSGDPKAPIAVLKFGGDVVADTPRLVAVLAEVAELVREGWRVLVCHGGGPQANALQRKLDIPVRRVGGRRITDAATLEVMVQVLAGQASVAVLAAARAAGLSALGVSGVSAGIIDAERRPPITVTGVAGGPVDFGHVGRVRSLNIAPLALMWSGGYTPVLNTLGVGDEPAVAGGACPVFNINADTIATRLAATLGAAHLFLMTGVGGVLADVEDPTTRIPSLNPRQARQAIADGIVAGGMIPKIEEALAQLERGLGAVHIVGSEPGNLSAAVRQPGSCGTVLRRDDGEEVR